MKSPFRVVLAALAAAIGLSLAFVGGGAPAMAGAYYPDPCLASRSTLCSGLLEHWNLDEASNSTRWGAYGTPLLEPQPAVNVGNRTGKVGSGSAVDFTGSTSVYLWNSLFGSPSTRFYTIGFWFWSDTAGTSGQRQALVSWDAGNDRGPNVWLYNQAGTLKLCHYVVNQESDNAVEQCNTTAVTTGAWHYAVAGISDYFTGNNVVFVSLDGAAKQTAALTFFPRAGISQIRVGGRPFNGLVTTGDMQFDGALDHLDIWTRALSAAEITLLYNTGSGKSYPYVDY
jgi:hypothetical protein